MTQIETKTISPAVLLKLDNLSFAQANKRAENSKQLPVSVPPPDKFAMRQDGQNPGVFLCQNSADLSSIWNYVTQERDLKSSSETTKGFTVPAANVRMVLEGINSGTVTGVNSLFRALYSAEWLEQKNGRWQIKKAYRGHEKIGARLFGNYR